MEHHVRISNPWNRQISVLLSILALSSCAKVFSQDQCIELSIPGSDRLFTNPGQVLSTGLSVTNRSTIKRTLTARLTLPPGWRSIIPGGSFDLGPRESDIRLLSIVVPATTGTGPYRISYSIRDEANSSCRADQILVVFVRPSHSLSLQILDSPRFVVTGRADTVTFNIRNQGNEPASVRIFTWSSEGLTVDPASTFTILGTGESRMYAVRILSEPGSSGGTTQILRLRARQDQDSTVEAIASAQFQIIAGTLGAPRRYREAPLQVILRGTGENGRTGGQVELSGSGSLTDGGQDRYSLLVRTPDIQSSSLLAARDEYRFGYNGQTFDVELGDMNYALSPLTEYGRYAFGAGGSVTSGDMTFGGFLNQTRFYSPSAKEEALFAGYSLNEQSAVSLNFLHKTDLAQSNIVSLRATMQLIRRHDVDLEYGLSSRVGISDRAYSAHLTGNEEWISYDLRYVHAGPNYSGYYGDVDSRSASVNIHPWDILRIEGYARDESRNLLLDSTTTSVAPLARVYQAGIGYGDYLSVYYRDIDQRDQFLSSSYNRSDRSLQLRSGYSFSAASIIASVALGSSLDRILNTSSPFQQYTLSGSIMPDNRQHYGASVEYTTERNLLTWDLLERWTGSLDASIDIGKSTQIQAGIFETATGAPSTQTSTILDASVLYTFPFHHAIGLRVRRSVVSPGDQEKDFAWLLEYHIPLQIPITRLTTTGDLTGRVLDAGTMRGIPNVVVYAGAMAAMTNEYGEYSFPGLSPDTYQVRPDQAAIGFDRMTTAPMPLAVPVGGGEESHADFYIIQGATVSGSIRVFEFRQGAPVDTVPPAYADIEPLGNILLELCSAADTLRRLSDNQGMFRFPLVRPGEWVLSVRDGQFPENHYIEKDSLPITLRSGDRIESPIRVLPHRRRIQILQEGKVEVEANPQVQRHLMAPRKFGSRVIFEDSSGAGYFVQASVWKSPKRALREAELIRRITGMKPTVRTLTKGESALVLGPFKTIAEAEAACRSIGP